MFKKIALGISTAAIMTAIAAGSAFAANPSGTGQPGAPAIGCGSGNATIQPQGFQTSGFSNAAGVYAGSTGTPSQNNANSSHAIAQYDVACFQLTSH